ncbi:hypothetical protein OV203_31330 [Nannocystis sp. ILAH1]|uniref:hypothetical protein n=1 Tax=unclassified Nannocystis TaxID=2627009 RepID=UPI00226E0317|nr:MULTISPECIES: hypothetical protein [unclassified Nannocystis]MCY0991677.1 hypothetical protein [Nannocystis sp. ILAH1]MCY1067224.1 hypothetical protein [Nannocystis sp. RBIL2]
MCREIGVLALASLSGLVGAPGPTAASPVPKLDDLDAEACYTHQQVPPLGIVEEQSQRFVDVDEQGRVLVDAVPAFGAAWEAGETAFTAFLWDGLNSQPLVPDGFFQTAGLAMNERGEVLLLATDIPGAGTISDLRAPDWTHAVIWKDGEVVASIPAPGGTIFEWGQINAHGHAMLSTPPLASGIDWRPRTYLWREGVVTALGEGYALEFNDADHIAGYSYEHPAFLRWREGERQVLAADCPSETFRPGGATASQSSRADRSDLRM